MSLVAPHPKRMPLAGDWLEADRLPTDADFIALGVAYRSSGGLARGDDLARLLEERGRGDFSSLARLIVGGRIFSFRWHEDFWVPLFQFDWRDLTVRAVLQTLLLDLSAVLDGWSIGHWFVQPNARLRGERPIECLDADPAAVCQAARGDRLDAASRPVTR